MQSRHCAAWAAELGGCEPKPTTISAYPSQSPSRAPACLPPSPGFPSPLLLCGLERKLRALQGSAARIWEGVGRGQGFPSICGKPGSGKVFQSSQQRLPRSPPPGEQTAARAPASPPPPPLPLLSPAARSGRLARSREAGRAPGGQALLGRKPQLTQAARKAEAAPVRPLGQRRGAYTWGPDGRAEAPGWRRPRGEVRAGGARASLSNRHF